MKIALSFPGCHRRGGVERIVLECAHYLAGREHQVTVFANEWEPDTRSDIQYRYVDMRKRPVFLRPSSYFRECTRELQGASYDALNTHGCVCPLGGVHWVQSIHCAWLERSKRFRSPVSAARIKQRMNPLHPVLLKLESRHFRERNYRKVIATTPEVKGDLYRYYGVPSDDVIVIPNGFAPAEFSPERREHRRADMRAELCLRPEQIALLFVANELERKGYSTILAALKRLKRSDIRLLVVGRTDAEQARREAERAGVADQVLVCGPTSDVSAFHAAADLFVLPTQYEAFCLAILEALGSGLPVITTTVPGARDAIVPGVNGALLSDPKSGVELAAALEPLLEAGTRARISASTPETVRQYQWPSVLARYEQVLLAHCA